MCDTWVAMADATREGRVIFGKNSDRPIFDAQPLSLYPRQSWPDGSTLQLEHVELPQASQTYATLGSGPYWCWGYEEGINEHGVVIGNEAIYTKSSGPHATASTSSGPQTDEGQNSCNLSHPANPRLGLLGMDLIRLALERCRTAEAAVRFMGELVESLGSFGSGVPRKSHEEGSYDGSFIVADPDESWILETSGTRWVARRVAHGVAAISNQPSVRTAWDLGSRDLIDYALEMGWWSESYAEEFDFARAYIDDARPRHLSQLRAMRTRELLAARAGEITPDWMKRIARDHYEDTFLGGPYFDAADPDFLTICMHASPAGFTWGNTASSCVAILPRTGDELPVFWWTPGPPCNGCYVPFFVHGASLPSIVSNAGVVGKGVQAPQAVEQDRFAPDSYWWLFRELLDRTKGKVVGSVPGLYPRRNAVVRARFDALEAEFATELPRVIEEASRQGQSPATEVLDSFTARCVEQVVAVLHELLDEFVDIDPIIVIDRLPRK